MRARILLATLVALGISTPAFAEFTKVHEKSEFIALVAGKTLTRPQVLLRVMRDGRIQGTGAKRAVTGNWAWKNGYFCRTLYWGGSEIGYNCEEVRASNGRMRFITDRRAGVSAVFRLR